MAWFKKKPRAAPAEKTANEKAADEMVQFEAQDEVPHDPRDWPSGKMVYLTYGNEGDEAYGEGATAKLGPAEVEHHEDGSVTVGGEKADAADYKGEPIKSGVVEQIEKSKREYRKIQQEHPELQKKADD